MPLPRRAAALGGLAAIGAAPLASAHAQTATRIIISNDTQPSSLKGQTWELFKREIEAELGARVQVQLHHSGTLYDQRGQVQALQLGAIQFISPVAGIYAATAPKLAVLGLPHDVVPLLLEHLGEVEADQRLVLGDHDAGRGGGHGQGG